jgi:hypothetical protein
MNRTLLVVGLLVLTNGAFAAENEVVFTEAMMTIAERTNFERTSTLEEVVGVLDALDAQTDLMHRETLLLTVQGREVPLVVLADPPISTPEQAFQSGKLVVYIQANIHGGEVEGKEASLIAMRDILYGDKQHLLENQILIFVPVYNADGNDTMDVNTRPNQELSPAVTGIRAANGYDLNRDGMIVEALETKALYDNVINRWDPDLLVDLHTTNGTWHGYSLTYAPSYHTAGEPLPSDYTAYEMLPKIQQAVRENFGLEFSWYGGFNYRDWPPTEFRTYSHAPRYLVNNMGLRNRMAILSETFSHDRFYKRVHAANVFIEEILEYTSVFGPDIQAINFGADVAARNSAIGQEKGVRFEMVALPEPLDLLSYNYIPFEKEDGTVDFVRSSELVVTEGVQNYNAFMPTLTSTVPSSYIFSGAFTFLKDKLEEHGIEVDILEADATFNGEVFVVEGIDKTNFPLNGHENTVLDGEFQSANRSFSRGDYIVSLNHRLAFLIFYLLEPQADDGLIFWNLFDEYLAEELAADNPVEYPVFKVH